MSKYVPITGNTFPVKDKLRAMGGRWDPDAKAWMVPEDKAQEARRIVLVTPTPYEKQPGARPSSFTRPTPRGWRPCGYPGCQPGYCDECDGEGYRHGR